MKRAILVGASKDLKSSKFLSNFKNDFLVAMDGGYYHYLNENIEPDLFVGDFDTLDKDKLKNPKKTISLSTIKDDTDTIQAIKYCLSIGINKFLMYGCLNGKIEHTIANIQTLSFLQEHNAQGYLIDEENDRVLFLLHNDEIKFDLSTGLISVFSLSSISKEVTISNMKYNVDKTTLTSAFPLGVSNEFIENKNGHIKVTDGTLLIVTNNKSIKSLLV